MNTIDEHFNPDDKSSPRGKRFKSDANFNSARSTLEVLVRHLRSSAIANFLDMARADLADADVLVESLEALYGAESATTYAGFYATPNKTLEQLKPAVANAYRLRHIIKQLEKLISEKGA